MVRYGILLCIWIVMIIVPVNSFFENRDNVENAAYEKEIKATVIAYSSGPLSNRLFTKVFYNGKIYEFLRGRGDTLYPINSNIYVYYNTKLDRVLRDKPELTYRVSIVSFIFYFIPLVILIRKMYKEKKNPSKVDLRPYVFIDPPLVEKVEVPNQKVRSWRKKRKMKRGG